MSKKGRGRRWKGLSSNGWKDENNEIEWEKNRGKRESYLEWVFKMKGIDGK